MGCLRCPPEHWMRPSWSIPRAFYTGQWLRLTPLRSVVSPYTRAHLQTGPTLRIATGGWAWDRPCCACVVDGSHTSFRPVSSFSRATSPLQLFHLDYPPCLNQPSAPNRAVRCRCGPSRRRSVGMNGPAWPPCCLEPACPIPFAFPSTPGGVAHGSHLSRSGVAVSGFWYAEERGRVVCHALRRLKSAAFGREWCGCGAFPLGGPLTVHSACILCLDETGWRPL